MQIFRIPGIAIHVTAYLGMAGMLLAQESPISHRQIDSLVVRDSIPLDAGKLYLQNFFSTPWYSMPGDNKPSGSQVDSNSSAKAGVRVGGFNNSFGMEWMRSVARYSGDEQTPFITYSRTSVALGSASAAVIWGTIAAQSMRERNNIATVGAAAAAALNIYQGFKLWKHVSVKAGSD